MPDYSRDPAFNAAVAAAEAGIRYLAGEGVADARALVDRLRGRNNLQGHYNALVPLAVLVLRKNPWLPGLLTARTSLRVGMTARSAEARDAVWVGVQGATAALLLTEPRSRIGSMLNGRVLNVENAATYLSDRYGGDQHAGGAGDTVLKRTLKLLAHMFHS